MQTNWIIIAIVAVAALGLIAYLIRQNLKDKEQVTRYFNNESSELNEEEEELNNER